MQASQGKFSKYATLTLSTLSLGTIAFVGSLAPNQARAETKVRNEFISTNITPIVQFHPPTDRRIGDSRGGASRSTEVKCSSDETYRPPMTPLLPASKQGLTSTSHPTFWVYIPPTSAPKAHFTLKDENNRGVYQTLIPITRAGEIISINLPTERPALEVGKTYQWSVALICQPTQTAIPIVTGQIQRIEPDVALQLEKKMPLEQAASYGRAGIWYDMLNSLALLKKAQPNDNTITANWVQLLNSEGLEDVATKPLR
jgi:hypothetical protein